jgi:hypothetical protein
MTCLNVAYSQQNLPNWRRLPQVRALILALCTSFGLPLWPQSVSAEALTGATPPPTAPQVLRVASFNVSLYRNAAGELGRELAAESPQAAVIAAVIQRVRPQLLLINEFDYDPEAAQTFNSRYLEAPQAGGGEPIRYPYHFIAPSNTGVPSGFDLSRDGKIEGGNDALGFGLFPGQYGMLVLSMLPIDEPKIRSFRQFLWRDMPNNLIPPQWYSPEALAVLPLSSKSHWDVPVILPDGLSRLHLLASHPTPPGFDGPEDRNGRRNHDEIRLWADYIGDDLTAQYLIDDQGRRGGLAADASAAGTSATDASFVIAGDLNADPVDGGSWPGAIAQLLDHPRVHAGAARGELAPRSRGGREAAQRQGGANVSQRGDPALDTADFSDGPRSVGNLRVDYALPSSDLTVCASGIFWPSRDEPEFQLVNDDARASSDHRLVWVDIALEPQGCNAR